ncbi:alpha/beta hydrolase family protein [Nocardia sp. NPDC052566]|uniref:alpha/beta hydrolase family protein n=1 Tax=Nocardia sp. NPDC052566 TaxID=3364330 RepID=UPI0037CBE995
MGQIDVATWQPAAYMDVTTFEEREVTLDVGALPVAASLSIPRGAGPHPAAVLLSGGGPFDRDATVGPNKTLKDLAWGLASRGIAVLRFDKASFTHAAEFWGTPGVVAADEYVPYGVSAIELLRAEPAVDSDRIFVAGHSMGGKFAPRVAEAAPSVAGVVILAGDTVPMQWAMVRVARLLAEIAPDTLAALPPIETMIEQAKLVDSHELSVSTPPSDLPFGAPGSYWLDLRDYDPVATAAALNTPMLILQGGRDYNVTVADDLAGWQAGLGDKPEVTIRIYPGEDHMFYRGSGVPLPADLERPQHVDREVIDDIADWLHASGR